MIQGGEICEVGTGSGGCEVAVQAEDWIVVNLIEISWCC